MEPKLIPDTPIDTGTNWIDDDGLLRDEGVIFGRAVGTTDVGGEHGPLHWKLEAIRSHYRRLVAGPEAAAAACEEHIEALEEEYGQARTLLSEAQSALTASADEDAPQRARDFAGFLFSLTACVGVPVVVLDLLRPDAFEYPIVVAVVAAAAGLFSLFQSRSVLFVSHAHLRRAPELPEPWKVYLTETLPPLAAAAFVATFAYAPGELAATMAAFAFLAVVFWVTGRLTLSTLPRIASAFSRARRMRRLRDEAEDAREKLRNAEATLAEVEAERRKHLVEVARLEHLSHAKVSLFLSEFELARRYAQLHYDRQAAKAPTSAGDHSASIDLDITPGTSSLTA